MPQYPDGTRIHEAEWGRLLQAIPSSYTIWKDGTTIRAESNISGGTDYSGTVASTVIQNAIDALTDGGVIFVRTGIYELTSALTINTDGISIVGEGSGRNQVYFLFPPSPLARLTKGTVFKVTVANTNAISITGRRFGINLAHFGIDFTQVNTGHGISCTAAVGNIGLSEFEFDDIFVNDHGIDKYALYMESPCLGSVTHLHSYGGGLLDMVSTDTLAAGAQFYCGNIQFNDMYAWITKAMTQPPFYMRRTSATGILGLCQFNRLQMNCVFDLGVVYAMEMLYTQFSSFISLAIECTTNNGIAMGGCKDITFIEPMMNQPDYWSVAADCENIRVFGGFINSIVDDKDATDTYTGTWMLDVAALNVAKLIDCKVTAANLLTNNRGKATILNGTATIAVTHGLRTTPTYITLTGTHEEVHEAYATTIGAASFTITVDGNVTANRDVYWYASCDQ
jgi:hypothetical protein